LTEIELTTPTTDTNCEPFALVTGLCVGEVNLFAIIISNTSNCR